MSEDTELTIDELAQEAAMTVRNVRAHQSRGLLQTPRIQGRVGYYGPEHVARLRLIRDMQAEGFNLKAIERLLAASNGAGESVLDFGRALLDAFHEEEPEFTTADELTERLGVVADDRVTQKAERLGLIRPLGDGRYEIPSPTLLRAGEELVALGIPVDRALDVAETIERHSRSIAESFVRLFMEELVGTDNPIERSPEEWERLREALERLRPLATEAVRAGFQQTMSRTVERRLEKMLGDTRPRRGSKHR